RVEPALGGVAGGAGQAAGGLAEDSFLLLGARKDGGKQGADREAADHRRGGIDGELVGGLAGDVAGAVARGLIGRRRTLARGLIDFGRAAADALRFLVRT